MLLIESLGNWNRCDAEITLETGDYDRYITVTFAYTMYHEGLEKADIDWSDGAEELNLDTNEKAPASLTLREIADVEKAFEAFVDSHHEEIAAHISWSRKIHRWQQRDDGYDG